MNNLLTNEELWAAAKDGVRDALDALVMNNVPFVKKTAGLVFREFDLSSSRLGIEFCDLEQEGCIGLWNCVEKYDPSKGVKFLTYAAPAIRNRMIDLIRKISEEKKGEDDEQLEDADRNITAQVSLLNASADTFILDLDLVGDPIRQNPEQIYLRKELYSQLYRALKAVGDRSRAYLLFRYGFEDGDEHSVAETAEHFTITITRAKRDETTALNRMRREMT